MTKWNFWNSVAKFDIDPTDLWLFLRLGALFSPLLELLAGATSDQVQMELH